MTEISRLFLGTLLLASVSCSSQVSEIKSTDVPKLGQTTAATNIKARWEEQCKKLDPAKLTKDYPGRKLEILLKLSRMPLKKFLQKLKLS